MEEEEDASKELEAEKILEMLARRCGFSKFSVNETGCPVLFNGNYWNKITLLFVEEPPGTPEFLPMRNLSSCKACLDNMLEISSRGLAISTHWDSLFLAPHTSYEQLEIELDLETAGETNDRE